MQSAPVLSKIEKRKQGKALREKCPRSLRAEWKPRSKSQDIVKLLEEPARPHPHLELALGVEQGMI